MPPVFSSLPPYYGLDVASVPFQKFLVLQLQFSAFVMRFGGIGLAPPLPD